MANLDTTELMRDCTVTLNIGGNIINFWQSVGETGAEMHEYPATPVGGPPAFNTCDDVRTSKEFSISTWIPGDTESEQMEFINLFPLNSTYEKSSSAASSGQIQLPGDELPDGTKYKLMSKPKTHSYQDNAVLTLNLKECGRTETSGSGTGS